MTDGYHLGHRPALDGLRGVAILLVLAGHLMIPGLDSGGWPGVTLFFVLSGFLITTLLLEERERTGRIDLLAFYRRRARRLLPALGIFLAVVSIALAWAGTPDLALWVGSVLLYVANWGQLATETYFGPFVHLWSLAVEEQFYIVWPGVLILGLAAAHGRLAPILVVILAAAVASALWRVAVFDGTEWGLQRAYFGTDTRADGLLVGAAIAFAFRMGHVWRPSRAVVILAGVALLATALPTGEGQATFAPALLTIGLPVAALASGVLVAAAATGTPRPLTLPSLRGFGRISYALYLWQEPLLIAGAAGGFALGYADAGRWVGVGLAVAVAAASWRWIERPWRSAKDVGVERVIVSPGGDRLDRRVVSGVR